MNRQGKTTASHAVSCQSLMLDDISRSDTIPAMDIRTQDADVGHEAKIGRISDEAVFYLMSRCAYFSRLHWKMSRAPGRFLPDISARPALPALPECVLNRPGRHCMYSAFLPAGRLCPVRSFPSSFIPLSQFITVLP